MVDATRLDFQGGKYHYFADFRQSEFGPFIKLSQVNGPVRNTLLLDSRDLKGLVEILANAATRLGETHEKSPNS